MLPGNREKRSMNDVRHRKVARQQQVGRQTQFVGAKFAYIGKVLPDHI